MDSSSRVVRSRYFYTFFLLLLTPILYNCSKYSSIPNDYLYEIKIGDKSIHVEVAATQKKRTLGLMFRDKLEEDHGMLFIYPQEQHLSFWMKNTKIPLSIAFINSNGEITQIESMTPYSLINHASKDRVRYALEMEDGWFRKNGVKGGSKVRFSSEINKINVR